MALDFFAGCVGGCAGILVGHPLDTIKVHLQTQDFRNPIYRGTFHCFQTILQKESMSGLYRGMSSPMAGVALINAIMFGVYGNIQRRMDDPDSLSSHFVAGFSAGIAQSFVCSPMELAKTRIQVQQRQVYRSCLQCILQIARTEGVRGVYRGLGVTMVRDAPGMGSYFLSYELMTRSSGTEPISTMRVMVAGGLAGSISWVSTFPLDVIKSRLQVDGMYGPAKYSGALDCFRQGVKAEGYSFLVRGLTSTLIRAFPVNAATFTAVTWVFRLAGVGSSGEDSVVSPIEKEHPSIKLIEQDTLWGLKGEKWQNLALTDVLNWRKLMMNSMAGCCLINQHMGLRSELMSFNMAQQEGKSTNSLSDVLLLENSNTGVNFLTADVDDEGGSEDLQVCIQQLSEDETVDLICSGKESEGTIDQSTLREKYRTSNHENG